ncbi:MAG: amidase [Gammaproteobacteria bacterium]|nr:amidase [Gammaproteobacteria bacterium]
MACLLLGIVTPHALAQGPEQSFQWQPYDESEELRLQAEHELPRMRFKLLNSKYLDKNLLWSSFTEELSGFDAQQYETLKPLIMDQDIPALQLAVQEQRLSYEILVKFYLYRIRLFESDNTRSLNAIIAINLDVIAEARRKDRARTVEGVAIDENSLFGIPILLKDNIGVRGMPTTAGAVVLQQNNTGDAFITRRLKANGAIILGKANLSEWAYLFCDGCPLGYSALGGQTLNPYGRKQIESGGSSSGSAAAVAANYAAAAVGSETSGSILSPASLNSLVGLKPTTGMLSRTGVIPISSTLDTAGPITRNVTDAVILFNAMSGYDRQDLAMPLLSADVELVLRKRPLADMRLGYFPNLVKDNLYKGAVDTLRKSGAELIEIEMPDVVLENFGEFLKAEMKIYLADYLTRIAGDDVEVKTVGDVVKFNRMQRELRMPYGQSHFNVMESANYNPGQINAMRDQLRASGTKALSTPLRTQNLDALLSINNYHAAFAASANYPALTVPMGYREDGEPAGITFIGVSFSEQELVDIGLAFENVSAGRSMPADYQ